MTPVATASHGVTPLVPPGLWALSSTVKSPWFSEELAAALGDEELSKRTALPS